MPRHATGMQHQANKDGPTTRCARLRGLLGLLGRPDSASSAACWASADKASGFYSREGQQGPLGACSSPGRALAPPASAQSWWTELFGWRTSHSVRRRSLLPTLVRVALS